MNSELTIGSRIKHDQFGDGIICRIGIGTLTINFFNGGIKEINRKSESIHVVEVLEGFNNMVTVDEIEEIFENTISKFTELSQPVKMGDKWMGGTLYLEPKDTDMQGKEIPIDTFFRKIVMVRDKLRVLEQNINSHSSLNDEEKVHLQQYITKAYGSLTTFNILFRTKEEGFTGSGKK